MADGDRASTREAIRVRKRVKKPKIYVASSLGFLKEAGSHFYYEELIPTIREAVDCEIIDPWALSHEETARSIASIPEGARRRKALENLNVAETNEELALIRRSNGVVAYLNGSDVDSGVAFEMGYAHALKLPIVGIRTDFRPAGDNVGCDVNRIVEFPIKSFNRKIARTLDELKVQVREVFGRK
jgi:nucleoside 2-deoxyribosyltransferase